MGERSFIRVAKQTKVGVGKFGKTKKMFIKILLITTSAANTKRKIAFEIINGNLLAKTHVGGQVLRNKVERLR